jgi:hypothetical protein
MNYASAFLVLILGAAAIFWYISGRKYYTGPITEALEYDNSESDRHSSGMERKAEKEAMV